MDKNKQIEINRLLKNGIKTRQISKELHVSLRDVKYYEIKEDKVIPTIPHDTNKTVSKGITAVSQQIRSTNPNRSRKKPFDLTIAVLLKEIFRSYGKQYGSYIKDTKNLKYPVRMGDFEKVEKYLSGYVGVAFHSVLS